MKNTYIFKKILVAVDGSENSDRAVNYGIRLARQSNCKLYLLYVIDQKILESYKVLKKDSYEVKKELSEKGHFILSRIKKLAEKNEINVETKTMVGFPYQKILDYSEEVNADLIIIGHESTRRPLTSHHVGNTVKRILEYMRCPILVVN